MRNNGIEIKTSRGDIATRVAEIPLSEGELFFQIKNDSNQFPKLPYSEGELLIGLPSLDKSDKNYEVIADRRTLKALVCKGYLTDEEDSSDEIFKHVSVGDFFIWKNKATKGYFGLTDKFKQGDLLVVLTANKDKMNNTIDFSYRRFTTGVYSAEVLDYQKNINSEALKNADNVRDAIDTVNKNSLHYKGTLDSTYNYAVQNEREIGSLYSIINDGVEFNSGAKKFSTMFGDLVVYQGETTGWVKISTGVKASNISIDLKDLAFNPTFEKSHVEALKAVSNIQELLYYLSQNKAQINSEGKVPLSQLPDTILGSLRWQGIWNPVKNKESWKKEEGQNYWPGFTFDTDGSVLNLPTVGYFWIVQTEDSFINIPYVDKDSVTSDGVYTRTIELNKGDWVVYTADGDSVDYKTAFGGHFEVIDNSDRVRLVRFLINSYVSNKELVPTSESPEDKVGEVTLGTTHKIGLYKDPNGEVKIGGIRLVDQSATVDSKPLRIPRYIDALEGTDTIEPGSILDTNQLLTIFNNLNVGSQLDSKLTTLWGNLHLKPNFNGLLEDGTTSEIVIFREENHQLFAQTLHFKKFESGSIIQFPDASSAIAAFLDREEYKPNYLLKRKIVDGQLTEYFTDSNLEEHLDSSVMELHLKDLTVPENINTLSVTFGDVFNPKEIDDKGVSKDLRKTIVHIDDEQEGNTEVTLPVKSGRLLTIERFNELLSNGKPDWIPIFAEKEEHGDTVLVESTLSMQLDYLYQFFLIAASTVAINESEVEISLANLIFRNHEFKDLRIESDVVIGTDIDPKSLAITGVTLFGNSATRLTAFVPGRDNFRLEQQYKNPRTKEALPNRNTIQEFPPESGILLNNRSWIDGGEYF